jgi:hypothetical protein
MTPAQPGVGLIRVAVRAEENVVGLDRSAGGLDDEAGVTRHKAIDGGLSVHAGAGVAGCREHAAMELGRMHAANGRGRDHRRRSRHGAAARLVAAAASGPRRDSHTVASAGDRAVTASSPV